MTGELGRATGPLVVVGDPRRLRRPLGLFEDVGGAQVEPAARRRRHLVVDRLLGEDVAESALPLVVVEQTDRVRSIERPRDLPRAVAGDLGDPDGNAHGSDIPWDVTISEDGTRAVVTGESADTETDLDYTTIAYDMASGEKVWSASYDATAASDGANGVVLDRGPDGKRRVYLTGASTIGFDPVGIDSNIDAAAVAYFDPFE
ncbi:hypothetical protein ACIA03_29895 [Nocardioides sp. NPDC051685]|uniref:hypothetical protein n=1 Tax=Nocardioides sp. NPDC051685 TaxID=3364334 RepID=UPI00379082F5